MAHGQAAKGYALWCSLKDMLLQRRMDRQLRAARGELEVDRPPPEVWPPGHAQSPSPLLWTSEQRVQQQLAPGHGGPPALGVSSCPTLVGALTACLQRPRSCHVPSQNMQPQHSVEPLCALQDGAPGPALPTAGATAGT